MRWIARFVLLFAVLVVAACSTDPGHGVDHELPHENLGKIGQAVTHDCTTSTDTGYSRGIPTPITLVTVQGQRVEIATADAYMAMADAAAAAGVYISINSGFRTNSEQIYLYNCYVTCSCNGCNEAASPGWSNHQSGHALDLNTSAPGVYSWLAAHGAAYGWRRTVASELWHWEWWGGGPGTNYCRRPDADGDGSPEGVDCDDHNPNRTPGKAEVCDGIDNNCNGVVDEGLVRACGSNVGECRQGRETCSAGAWGACVGAINPVPESCDDKDNDCDGATDEDRICEHEEVALSLPVYGDGTHSDVNGDGRADACALAGPAFQCLLSGEHGFARVIPGPSVELTGLTARDIVPTMRMGDVNGDGRADLCSRVRDNVVCWASTGNGFSEQIFVAPIGTAPSGALAPMLLIGNVGGDAADDVCIRDVAGLRCYVDVGRGTTRVLELSALSDAAGYADVIHHGSIRLGDINGDGLADVCARSADGVVCFLADGSGFPRRIVGPAWTDAAGWGALRYWSTIRLADVDGDGRKDLCGRGPDGFVCHLSDGNGFSTAHFGPRLLDAEGWNDRSRYTTLRMGDIDGDGKADVCARDKDRVFCWLWTGTDFSRVLSGPTFSDAEGFAVPTAYRSFRLGDIDSDGKADVCARNQQGLRCFTSANGRPLDRLWSAPAWDDDRLADSWSRMSIRLAGGAATGGGGAIAKDAPGPEEGGCGCGTAPRATTASALSLAVVLGALLMRRRTQ